MRGLAYFLGIAAGFGLTLQIGMNSQLRTVLQSANTAALISFLVGTVALVGLLLATRTPMPARDTLASVPVWAWFGGLLGAFYVAISTVVASRARHGQPAGAGVARATGHGAGGRSLRLAGSAGTSDYPYSPGGRSPAGRGRLADHALKPRELKRARRATNPTRKEGLCELTNCPGISWRPAWLAAVLLPAAIVYGHPDAMGTRFVAPAAARTPATATTTIIPAAR